MSLFLAPIHYWLYDKIKLIETIEKEIVVAINQPSITKFENDLQTSHGSYTKDEPLENIIDTANIHGWLQGKITLTESRQAKLVKQIIDELGDTGLEQVKSVYYKYGQLSGQGAFDEKPDSAVTLFNKLNDFLLEGMPCDRVNAVEYKKDEDIKWQTVECVHKTNWENSGVPVDNYYNFRASFIDGFVTGSNDTFNYTYSNNGQQAHRIAKA